MPCGCVRCGLTRLWCVRTGWPRLKWVVTDTKYLTKPSKDWQPHIPTANTDTAYIEVSAGQEWQGCGCGCGCGWACMCTWLPQTLSRVWVKMLLSYYVIKLLC